MPLTVRPAHPHDLPHLLRLNQRAVPNVNSLSPIAFADLLATAEACLVVTGTEDGAHPAGFLLGLGPGLGYASENYRWFDAEYDDFFYIDRVVVAESVRGQGVGSALYGAAALLARGRGSSRLCCEVNLEPPNPGSLRFHERLGFTRVGEQSTEGGSKQVVLLVKSVPAAPPIEVPTTLRVRGERG